MCDSIPMNISPAPALADARGRTVPRLGVLVVAVGVLGLVRAG